jgi:hypothetical protein
MKETDKLKIHKEHHSKTKPAISIILLDWSVRERFQALDWLSKQDVSRDQYELIWIELYDRVVSEAMDKADVVIACGQEGMYHKHLAYNIGLLRARGKVITICDSDAIFPSNFVSSVINSFELDTEDEPRPLVLMHYEWRTRELHPAQLNSIDELSEYQWADLWPNVGACMSVATRDAVRFGGFDEHPSYRGYMCGPYDLGWRLVNAGIPEIWHDASVALWHFSHPDPPGTFDQQFSLKLWKENTYPHIEGHALTAVEAFSTGRILPLTENPEIYRLRLARRQIGTKYEEGYAHTLPRGISKLQRAKLKVSHKSEPIRMPIRKLLIPSILRNLKSVIGTARYNQLKKRWHQRKGTHGKGTHE